MRDPVLADALAELWRRRFRRKDVALDACYEPWLERYEACLQTAQDSPVLDLGCGAGCDSRFLVGLGLSVVSLDVAQEALCCTGRRAPEAWCTRADLREGLPFTDEAFGVIVASLSLHYLRHADTHQALAEVRRCLRRRGYLVARFNSVRDVNYGASASRNNALEPGVYLVDGEMKRFFSRADLETLGGSGWRTVSLEERVTGCYGRPKVVWELCAQRHE